jgi:hypothetical protein
LRELRLCEFGQLQPWIDAVDGLPLKSLRLVPYEGVTADMLADFVRRFVHLQKLELRLPAIEKIYDSNDDFDKGGNPLSVDVCIQCFLVLYCF